MTTPPVDQLAEACREGDEQAFGQLYQSCADGVYHVALQVLGIEEDARDTVQETFLTAYRRFSTYRGEGSLRGWLLQIGFRIALRQRKRRRGGVEFDEHLHQPEPAEETPSASKEAAFQQAVASAIDSLPERARLVFTLRTVHELSHAEIAQSLGIHEGTSKSQLSYARTLLQRRLARWRDEL